MNRPHIPPAVSQATSKARQWFERNRRRFGYYLPERTDRTFEQAYDDALDEVETPLHLYALSEAFQARALPETKDRAANPTTTRHTAGPTRTVIINPAYNDLTAGTPQMKGMNALHLSDPDRRAAR